ncbi:MAG: hypothetical protein OQK09_00600 [Colwellia sp.]|nr:hypothetical protein [Colwellia sp.]MCW8866529.1 hypothetical protein [Colwellia sp.]MCW9079987.1 hypothetical protein [Colwellia sp.]
MAFNLYGKVKASIPNWKFILFSKITQSPMRVISFALLLLATLVIFSLAEVIRFYLKSYSLEAMFISFCAGFILFTPLVSLVIHPLFDKKLKTDSPIKLSAFLGNVALVVVVQLLCFLIWMTDAIALYSLYVDQNSFLAKAFNITVESRADLSVEFYWFNIALACFFALLSLVVGVLPCLFSRTENNGVVGNFVSAFSFAKRHKKLMLISALGIVLSVVFPLLYAKFLFLILFPAVLLIIFSQLSEYARVG